jgi:peptide/nickel transport system permease protein
MRRVLGPRVRALSATLSTVPITLFGLVLVTFLIGRVVPIDPVLAVVGDRAPQDVVERARLELGLDRPLPEQFVRYLGQVVSGDFGRSVMTSNPVTQDIARFFPATFELATAAILLAALVGVPLGVLAAVRQGTWTDQAVRLFCLAGHSLPVFVLGLLSLLVFYANLGWAPGPGRQGIAFEDMVDVRTGVLTLDAALAGDWPAFRDALAHLAQPAGVLAFFSLAYIARMTRAFMLAELRSEYVITARAKGLSGLRIVWRHAFPNIAVPLVTVLALTYAGLLEGAVLTETIFSWPGLGQYLTVSLLNADMNAVLGATLVVGLIYVALNLFADMLYRLLDPRVR